MVDWLKTTKAEERLHVQKISVSHPQALIFANIEDVFFFLSGFTPKYFSESTFFKNL